MVLLIYLGRLRSKRSAVSHRRNSFCNIYITICLRKLDTFVIVDNRANSAILILRNSSRCVSLTICRFVISIHLESLSIITTIVYYLLVRDAGCKTSSSFFAMLTNMTLDIISPQSCGIRLEALRQCCKLLEIIHS